MSAKQGALVRAAIVELPHGESAPIRLRGLTPPDSPIEEPTDRLLDYYSELKVLSEQGDANAALALYKDLNECERAFSSMGALQGAIEKLRTQHVYTFADSPTEYQVDADQIEQMEESMVERYTFCEGVTEAQKDEKRKWLKIALTGGGFWAQQAYAMSLGDTPEAAEAWTKAWSDGYWGALSPLYILASKGITSDGVGEPDLVRLYALRLIEFGVLKAASQGSVSPVRSRHLAIMEDQVRQTGGALTPQQAAEGVALAKELLSNNPNCCRIGYFRVSK